MTCRLVLLLAVGLWGQLSVAVAQPAELGNWLLYLGNKQLNERWNLWHEVQLRQYNAVGDLEQLLLRTGLGYRLDDNGANLLLGYAYIRSENYIGNTDDKVGFDESRLYQQLTTRQSIGRVQLQHRYRFEQRFVEGAAETVRLRFRYFLGINVPLLGPTIEDKEPYLTAYNEIFLNKSEPTLRQIFDRDRVYGGLGYRLNEHLRFELAYMNQIRQSPVASRDQINVVVFASF